MLDIIRRQRRKLLLPVLLSLVAAGVVLGYVFGSSLMSNSNINPGNIPPNILSLDQYTITTDSGQSNPTVLTMSLRNTGTSTAALNTLTVKDLSSGSSVALQMSGSTVAARGGTSTVTVDTLSSGFYFVHGHSYSLTVVTSTAQFTFSPESYP